MNLSSNMQRTLDRLKEEDTFKPGSWHYASSIRELPATFEALFNRGLVERRNEGLSTQYRIKGN